MFLNELHDFVVVNQQFQTLVMYVANLDKTNIATEDAFSLFGLDLLWKGLRKL